MKDMEIPPIIKIFLLPAIIVVVFLGLYNVLNNIAANQENMVSSWGQVENKLQLRFDLVSRLVNTLGDSALQEKDLLEDITNSTSEWNNAHTTKSKLEAANKMDALLSRLLTMVEKYPDLKANPDFLRVQGELSEAENAISVDREGYNGAVKRYNALVRNLPGNIIAPLFGYKPETEYRKSQE
ncbi:MAG TPA: LemA family protein [Candidatus Margulisiibacteriota bacterium]|nr:LemA family protein [Candidatus Margulisiibacteriota bacterium]